MPQKCSCSRHLWLAEVLLQTMALYVVSVGERVATRLSPVPQTIAVLSALAGQWELAPVLGEWKLLQQCLNEVNSHLCTFPKQKEQCQVELQLKYHGAEM